MGLFSSINSVGIRSMMAGPPVCHLSVYLISFVCLSLVCLTDVCMSIWQSVCLPFIYLLYVCHQVFYLSDIFLSYSLSDICLYVCLPAIYLFVFCLFSPFYHLFPLSVCQHLSIFMSVCVLATCLSICLPVPPLHQLCTFRGSIAVIFPSLCLNCISST